jgi:hypothetical protein
MHAMHYELTLPADYDMAVVHRRVAARGALTDAFPGLGLKAYLVRERAAGAPVNQYAPFYLWATGEGMNRFLWGDGFRALCEAFGRPAVWHGLGVAFARGPARAATPRAASRRVERVGPDAPAAAAVESARAELARRVQLPGVFAAALAADLARWELVHFTLWADTPAEVLPGEPTYRVLHLSAPRLSDLEEVGR